MHYLDDLEKICCINSFTKNKQGVDNVALQMQTRMEDLNFITTTYKRENLGNHQLFKSKHITGDKIFLLGYNDTVFAPNTFETFTKDEQWVYGSGVCDMKGVGTYTINIQGQAAYTGTSYTEGINANLEASYKLQELVKFTNRDIGTTVNVGKITGGIGVNTISPKCEWYKKYNYRADTKE